MVFEFVKNPTVVTVYGETHEIPTKTNWFVDEVNKIHMEIAAAETSSAATSATLMGIALFLGEKFVKEHFPDVNEVDTDEIGALWVFLNRASAQATQEVLNRYAPAQLSR